MISRVMLAFDIFYSATFQIVKITLEFYNLENTMSFKMLLVSKYLSVLNILELILINLSSS